MTIRTLLSAFFILVVMAPRHAGQANDAQAIARAQRVLELLREEKFDEVVKEFDEKMAAALPAPALSKVWATLLSQVGAFESEIDRQVASSGGITAVTIGCRFEKAALNTIVAFDSENRVAGLRFVPRPSPPAAQTSPPAGLVEDQVVFGRPEFPLPGTLTLPPGNARVPGIVLVHGSGPQDRDSALGPNKPMRDLAWGLAARGIAVLRYEKRTKEHPEQMIRMRSFTIHDETVEDAILAAARMRGHSRIDPSKVFVLGHSQGGYAAPRIAKGEPGIAGLVILAGNTRSLQELILEQSSYLASIAPNASAQQAGLDALRKMLTRTQAASLPPDTPAEELMGLPAAYWNDLNAYNPVALAASLNVPMLILQGERDYQVTMADFEGWKEGLGGKANVTFKSYADLNHLFITGAGKSTPAEYEHPGKVAEAVIDDIANWIKQR